MREQNPTSPEYKFSDEQLALIFSANRLLDSAQRLKDTNQSWAVFSQRSVRYRSIPFREAAISAIGRFIGSKGKSAEVGGSSGNSALVKDKIRTVMILRNLQGTRARLELARISDMDLEVGINETHLRIYEVKSSFGHSMDPSNNVSDSGITNMVELYEPIDDLRQIALLQSEIDTAFDSYGLKAE